MTSYLRAINSGNKFQRMQVKLWLKIGDGTVANCIKSSLNYFSLPALLFMYRTLLDFIYFFL